MDPSDKEMGVIGGVRGVLRKKDRGCEPDLLRTGIGGERFALSGIGPCRRRSLVSRDVP